MVLKKKKKKRNDVAMRESPDVQRKSSECVSAEHGVVEAVHAAAVAAEICVQSETMVEEGGEAEQRTATAAALQELTEHRVATDRKDARTKKEVVEECAADSCHIEDEGRMLSAEPQQKS